MKLNLRERIRLKLLQRRIKKNEEFIFKCKDYVITARKWIKNDVKEAKELINKQDTPDMRIK